ncbi:hypothetical protein J0910_03430 [Nocardiopsis sp. CNT-189]
MTGDLAAADLARLSRSGLLPIPSEQGLDLFDAACAAREPVLLPARLDTAALRAAGVPGLFRRVVRAPARRAGAAPARTFQAALAGVGEADRPQAVLDLVRSEAAGVLGHSTAGAVKPEQAFTEAGFDSLTAVELRNRLNAATGLRLPSTLVFDFPNPAAVAAYVHERLAPPAPAPSGRGVLALLDDLAAALAGPGVDDGVRAEAAERLGLLQAEASRGPAASPADGAAGDVEGRIQEASADELLALIQQELGGSR